MVKNTIILKNYSNVFEEYIAGGDIYPGSLIELNSDGLVKVHDGTGHVALPMFAIEDALQGKGINDKFVLGDVVRCWIPNRGDIVYGILAFGEVVDIGDMVDSNGAGFLQKVGQSSGATGAIGVAIEKVDVQSSGLVNTSTDVMQGNSRVAIRII